MNEMITLDEAVVQFSIKHYTLINAIVKGKLKAVLREDILYLNPIEIEVFKAECEVRGRILQELYDLG